ncbi:MAG: tyrosine-type recombinase/integrase, partial [Rhodanobacteraceae bacterium]
MTDKIIRDAMRGAGKRKFPLWDGHGLHVISRGAGYHWRLKYTRPDGRENRLALGHYPEVSLAEARTLGMDARAKLRQGIDPAAERRAAKGQVTRTFESVARAWLEVKASGWSPITVRKNRRAVEHYLLPRLGAIGVADIETPDVLQVIQDTNKHSQEYAVAAASAARSIVRYASAHGMREQGHGLDLD